MRYCTYLVSMFQCELFFLATSTFPATKRRLAGCSWTTWTPRLTRGWRRSFRRSQTRWRPQGLRRWQHPEEGRLKPRGNFQKEFSKHLLIFFFSNYTVLDYFDCDVQKEEKNLNLNFLLIFSNVKFIIKIFFSNSVFPCSIKVIYLVMNHTMKWTF